MNILITGSNGYIGGALAATLSDNGHNVIKHSRKDLDSNIKCDLLDYKSTFKIFNNISKVNVLIHAAAIAHNQEPPSGYSVESANIKMLENLLLCTKKKFEKFIFLSSTDVFGAKEIILGAETNLCLKPNTEYGASKLRCEEILLKSELLQLHILRLPPVYDHSNLNDVSKRVMLLRNINVKFKLFPPPSYFFLNMENLISNILQLINEDDNGNWIYLIVDDAPYDQHCINNWFKGFSLPIPICLLKIILFTVDKLPFNFLVRIRDNITKLIDPPRMSQNKIRIEKH